MSRKTTGTTGTTRRRVAVGTALLSVTALLGAGLAAASGSTPTGTSLKVFGSDATTASGPLRGLNSVLELKGTHLDEVTSVFFGGTEASKMVVESSTLIYVTPPAHAAGRVDVFLSYAGNLGTSGVDAGDYTYTAGPVISAVEVADKEITITGSQLTGATAVLVGDTLVKVDTKKAPATDDKLVVKAPSVKGGSLDVSVVTPNGIGTKSGAYGVAPVISKVLPNLDKGAKAVAYASATGTVSTLTSATATVSTYASDTGTVVLLTGSGFSGLTKVSFGKAVADAVVVSDTIARVRIPARSDLDVADAKTPNVVKVEVTATNAFGTSKVAKFQYNSAPIVTAADDIVSVAKSGTATVTLTGANLKGAKVTFDKKAGKVSSDTAGSLTVTVPKTDAGDYSLTVTTPAGFFVLPVKYSVKAVDATTPWTAG